MKKEAVKKVAKETSPVDNNTEKIIALYATILEITENMSQMNKDIARLKIRIGL